MTDKKIPMEIIVIQPSKGWPSINLKEILAYKDLIYFFSIRNIMGLYKQTVLGPLLGLTQPIGILILFWGLFDQVAKVPTDDIPYPIFSFAAIIVWRVFSTSLKGASDSLTDILVKKIYFPRLAIPISKVMSDGFILAITVTILMGMMLYYDISLSWRIIFMPLFMLMAICLGMGIGLSLAGLNARFRDIRHGVPYLNQVFLFAAPVAYSKTMIPEKWQLLYSANPLVGIIDGFRWTLFSSGSGFSLLTVYSIAISLLLFVFGLFLFRRMEKTIADVL